jgi:hypothetical protein
MLERHIVSSSTKPRNVKARDNVDEQNEKENNSINPQTQGMTKQSMNNEAKTKEAFQRITTGALSSAGGIDAAPPLTNPS